ncbi:GIY-YIG nuclease family protein [Butyrivibrio proteoclasticus]|uniref:GIY-YIG nuclease family protein n=1 Tax=Butyrivibrio proteoclasticus TaxID=43305 RepID=UPI000478D3A4|nr:GIY-YIG nuclease family protein [Butyrivibrio proteoclasticus]
MTKGVIYILTNPSFPDYVKIGYAKDLEKRMAQLNRSETIPFAFRAYAIYEVDSNLTDLVLHDLIDRLNPDLRSIENFDGKERKREFYAMRPEEAYSLLECIAKISGTEDRLKKMAPEGHEILDEETAAEVAKESKRGPFKFSEVGIPVGASIKYVNDEKVEATVVDDRHISYKGVTTSVSALAQELLELDYQVQGTLYFTYEGERLTDRRDKIENSK